MGDYGDVKKKSGDKDKVIAKQVKLISDQAKELTRQACIIVHQNHEILNLKQEIADHESAICSIEEIEEQKTAKMKEIRSKLIEKNSPLEKIRAKLFKAPPKALLSPESLNLKKKVSFQFLEPPNFQIFVRNNGKTIVLDVNSDNTIHEVKEKIESKDGIPVSMQKVHSLVGKYLDDQQKLSYYNIQKESTLNLSYKFVNQANT